MTIIVNIVGIIILLAIVYWFWLSHVKVKKVHDNALITVQNGVYVPNHLEIVAQQKFTLDFLRKDESACSVTVIFKTLGINAKLPLNQRYSIELPPLKPGNYEFTCQMGMYRGCLTVKS